MSRSTLFADLARVIRIARHCDEFNISTAEGLEHVHAQELRVSRQMGRREWLVNVGRTAAAGAIASTVGPARQVAALQRVRQNVNVGIVGAGLAGLTCADQLNSVGIRAALYDASVRTGGRCFSLRGLFPGQVAERGGEFIDNPHKTMLGYAKRFNLPIEDVSKLPGEVFYVFDGQRWPEAVVVDQFREFVTAMRIDLRRLSKRVTADEHTETDVQLDNTSLLAYLEGQNGGGFVAGPVIKQAIIQAYIAEYGLAPAQQSCLNFLLFIHADRRSKFTPFGVFSDERWHVLDGNDRIVEGLTNVLATQIQYGMQLVRVSRTPAGAIELTFRGSQTPVTHDAVVLAIPFTVLRDVELDASLGLPPQKRNAIDALGYGTNAKMMVGFSDRLWAGLGSTGVSYSNLSHLQTTWETNPARASSNRAILTDYSGAERGATLNPQAPQSEAELFLSDLDIVYPGAAAAATRTNGQLLVHLEHWPSNPFTQGSYTCYLPGQFTTIAGIEGQPVDNLYFAGEHTNSFYEWQGFMEGAALSGIQAVTDILQAIKKAA
jgi:monoamine oxidase